MSSRLIRKCEIVLIEYKTKILKSLNMNLDAITTVMSTSFLKYHSVYFCHMSKSAMISADSGKAVIILRSNNSFISRIGIVQ